MIVIKVGGGKDLNIDAVVADIVKLRGAGRELPVSYTHLTLPTSDLV